MDGAIRKCWKGGKNKEKQGKEKRGERVVIQRF